MITKIDFEVESISTSFGGSRVILREPLEENGSKLKKKLITKGKKLKKSTSFETQSAEEALIGLTFEHLLTSQLG